MKKQNKGITLIALVITIIVLLILTGVSIATLTGENGILTQAEDAKKETTVGEEKEAIRLAYNGAMIESRGKGVTAEKLNSQFSENGTKATASGTDTIKIEFETGRSYTVDSKGNIANYVNIADYVKVGQYVDYEPTKTDLNKTQAVEASKLTYTSPIGGYSSEKGIITHGNGNSEQTFTAKANDGTSNGLKWRVLSIEDDKIELISETPVLKDATDQDNGNFVLKGGIGYLYAEQELNEVCKIYGYGYGADTNVGATFEIGGPEDPEFQQVKTIEEPSGARSITIEDLNKIAGITEEDYKTLDSNYGSTINIQNEIYYPTLSSSNNTYPGQSESTKLEFKYTEYSWNKSQIIDTNTQSMLFDGKYWIASRCTGTHSNGVSFDVYCVYNSNPFGANPCSGFNYRLYQYTISHYAVRPIVTLKPEVIDINTDYETEGEWKLK